MTAVSVSAPPLPVGPTVSANVAAHLAALADRRGWAGRAAFLEGHLVWTHGEVHDRAERAATVLADRGWRPVTGCCWHCPTASCG
ncbi:hypothetical protein [Streptomyces rhizosphaericus]|uniref:hypothetical protein n=1 Tax=Streptomyces rhizosphaericus TaxID=114699 RepID=UPI00362FFC75